MAENPANFDPPVPAPKSRRRRWFQFSLRTLLIFTLICAIPCAWLGRKIEKKCKEREAIDAIVKLGGKVAYDYQTVTGARPPGPEWLRTLLGEDFFSDVAAVGLNQSRDPREALANVRQMANLQWLVVARKDVTDAGLVNVNGLIKLKYLDLSTANVSDTGLVNLESMTELKTLNLEDTNITDAGLVSLKGLGKLQFLNLIGTKVTDGGLVSLKVLAQLQVLRLTRSVDDHRIRDGAGMKELQKALPNCTIHYSDGLSSGPNQLWPG